jgi:hypothetical protein
MPSWEDWDYWLRMARAGKCFDRIAEPLVVYRFYRNRREIGIQSHANLIKYLSIKYKEKPPMACKSCGGNKPAPPYQPMQQPAVSSRANAVTLDQDMVMVRYSHPNRGQHRVNGYAIFEQQIGPSMFKDGNGFRFSYGYRGGGDEFLVHRRDIELHPGLFVPLPTAQPAPTQQQVQPDPPPAKLAFDPVHCRVTNRSPLCL